MRRHLIGLLILLVAGLLYPTVMPGSLTVGITMLLFAGWATSWDILGGWSGQVSLGHASFVGIGAYFVAIGAIDYELAPWWSILLAMAAAMVLALFWGRLTFRLHGLLHASSSDPA